MVKESACGLHFRVVSTPPPSGEDNHAGTVFLNFKEPRNQFQGIDSASLVACGQNLRRTSGGLELGWTKLEQSRNQVWNGVPHCRIKCKF